MSSFAAYEVTRNLTPSAKKAMYYVYVLRSEGCGRLYIGSRAAYHKD